MKDIIDSWLRTFKPTESQQDRAMGRKLICEECPSKREGLMGVKVCGECYCPIIYNDLPIGKLYTNESCPLGKW